MSRRKLWSGGVAALALVIAALAVFWPGGKTEREPVDEAAPEASLLPAATEYYSLLGDPANRSRLLLGTSLGVHESTDGGHTWQIAGLAGKDTVSLAWDGRRTVWAAGPLLFARSRDGGRTWTDVKTKGMPLRYLRTVAVDRRNVRDLYAAVAGRGLYRSLDGGRTFRAIPGRFGANVGALAVTQDGRLLAGDLRRGMLVSANRGKTWQPLLGKQVLGIAIEPADPSRVLAVGHAIYLSTDGGRRWSRQLPIAPYAAAVAWTPSALRTAYVGAHNRLLYRSEDGGITWKVVTR